MAWRLLSGASVGMVTNPLPMLLVALTALVPGILLLALRASRALFKQGFAAIVVALGLALGGWVLLTHVIALLSGSFVVGLVLSTTVLGVSGYITARHSWGAAPAWDELPSSLFWCVVVGLSVPVAIIALRWDFHDETGQNGHIAIVASILNAYPPRNLSFPQFPLQYHYGFDLLCAMLVALLRLSLVRAIDVATIFLWVHSLLAIWLVGERVVGRGVGTTLSGLVALGGGLPFTCAESLGSSLPAAGHLLYGCARGDAALNPPLISYFFQHPWSLGLPLGLCCLLIQAQERRPRRWLRIGCLCVLLAALCLTQAALFCGLVGAILASELLDEMREPWSFRLVSVLVLLVTSGLAVVALGGFWSQPEALRSRLILHWGVANSAEESLRWMAATFGVLVLGLLGVFWLERRRVLFLSLALGGALVINVIRYTDTWDIVKFATVAGIGLAVLLAGLLKRLRASRWSALRVGLPAALGLSAVFGGLAFTFSVAADLPGVPGLYRLVAPDVSSQDRSAAEFLRARMPVDAVMYRRYSEFRPYALFAGLPQVWVETMLPINMKLLPGRTELVTHWPAEESAYLAHGLRFFVLDGADGRIGDVVDAWLAKGSAVLLRRFGNLRVVELLPARAGAGPADVNASAFGSGARR